MIAKRIPNGGTIGVFCPSHVADTERYAIQIAGIERMGFRVKLGGNIYKDTWGYAASAEERAADFNALIADDSVDAILFNGGSGAAEILPFIDYEGIRRKPKRIGSYSDNTSVLNVIHAQTGLVVYYGTSPSMFEDMRHYDYMQFCAHFVEGYTAERFEPNSEWKTVCGGVCEGTLIGGLASLFAMTLANERFRFDDRKYVLFLESTNKYGVNTIATFLAFIEQSALMRNITGLIFGHYAGAPWQDLQPVLERFGERNKMPVVYTDDFGHGTRHGVLPIGIRAKLDAGEKILRFAQDDK